MRPGRTFGHARDTRGRPGSPRPIPRRKAPGTPERLEPRVLLSADLARATPIALDSSGLGELSGLIKSQGQGAAPEVDVFSYRAPASRTIEVRLAPDASHPIALSLSALDDQGHPLSPSTSGPSVADEFPLDVVAGTTYLVEVAALHPEDSGAYRLIFKDFGDDAATASPLAFPASAGVVHQSGTLVDATAVDRFRFVAPRSGLLSAVLAMNPFSPMGGGLSLLDQDGTIAEGNGGDPRTSQFSLIPVNAGQAYDLRVASPGPIAGGAGNGQYDLTLVLVRDDVGHDLASATPLTVPASSSAPPSQDLGAIAVAGRKDVYRFVAPATTRLTIREQAAPIGGLDPLLAVDDAAGNRLATDNNFDDTTAADAPRLSLVQVAVEAGQAYTIEAAGFGPSTGVYTLGIRPDDVGDTFDTASPINVSPSGQATCSGTIEAPGASDMYQFVAPFTGGLEIRQDAPDHDLDSFLNVYDDSRRLITFNDDTPQVTTDDGISDAKDSLVRLDVVAGRTYFVRAAAFPNRSGLESIGRYVLTFQGIDPIPPDSFGNTFAAASPVSIASGFARLSGAIVLPTDVNLFEFTAPSDESVIVRLSPGAGSPLQGYLYAFDGATQVLANDYNDRLLAGLSTDSLVQFNVKAGQAYYVQVASFRGAIGSYDLTFETAPTLQGQDDGNGHDFQEARPIVLDASGNLLLSGDIGTPNGQDVFRFTADRTGDLQLRMFAAPGSGLDPYLYVFDDSGLNLAQDDDADVVYFDDGDNIVPPPIVSKRVIDRSSALRFPVVAGKTYYLKAAGFGSSTGAYFLGVSPAVSGASPGDLYGGQIGDVLTGPLGVPEHVPVAPIDLGGGDATLRGTIATPGDQDSFRFVAPASGLVTVRQSADGSSALDSNLLAFNPAREPLAGNNDAAGTRDSQVQFNVTQGQTYYLKVGGFGTSTGAYVLTIHLDSQGSGAPGHDFAGAREVALPASGVSTFSGSISSAGGVDIYRFTAPASGPLTVRQDAAGSSPLDSLLSAFAAAPDGTPGSQDLIASDDDSGGSLNSRITIQVTRGRTYFLEAAGYGTSVGAYTLSLAPGIAAPDTSGTSFEDATPIQVDDKRLVGEAFGDIAQPGDSGTFRFVAPVTGPLEVRQEWTSGSLLDSYLFVFDASSRLLASNDDATIPTGVPGAALAISDSRVTVNAIAGRTYYLRAASSRNTPGPGRSPTGSYRLSLSYLSGAASNNFDDARDLPLPAAAPSAQSGSIEAPGGVDMDQFVPPTTGRLAIVLTPAAGSALDPVLIAYDDARHEIARGVPVAGGGTMIELDARAGVRDFVEASGYGSSLGGYRLTFTPVASGNPGGDLGSPVPLEVSASGAGTQAGRLDSANSSEFYQYVAPLSGVLTVRVDPGPAGAGPPRLRAFTIEDGTTTQVADSGANPGTIAIAVIRGQSYDLEVSGDSGFAGAFRLVFSLGASGAGASDIQDAGKAAFTALQAGFPGVITDKGQGPAQEDRTAAAVTDTLVRAFLEARKAPLASDYLLLWLDPVDFLLSDPQGRQSGVSAAQGRVEEVGQGFLSGDGALKLAIIPVASPAAFPLELIGVNTDPVLLGARLILEDGQALAPTEAKAPPLPVSLTPRGDLEYVLDFSGSPGPARPGSSTPAAESPLVAALLLTSGGLVPGPSRAATVSKDEAAPVDDNAGLLQSTPTSARSLARTSRVEVAPPPARLSVPVARQGLPLDEAITAAGALIANVKGLVEHVLRFFEEVRVIARATDQGVGVAGSAPARGEVGPAGDIPADVGKAALDALDRERGEGVRQACDSLAESRLQEGLPHVASRGEHPSRPAIDPGSDGEGHREGAWAATLAIGLVPAHWVASHPFAADPRTSPKEAPSGPRPRRGRGRPGPR